MRARGGAGGCTAQWREVTAGVMAMVILAIAGVAPRGRAYLKPIRLDAVSTCSLLRAIYASLELLLKRVHISARITLLKRM